MEVIKSISIIHSASRNYEAALNQCLESAEKSEVEVKNVIPVNDKEVGKTIGKKNSDLILVIGGDGTMIRTIANLINNEIPLLGINIGRLGFLTDLNVDSCLLYTSDAADEE